MILIKNYYNIVIEIKILLTEDVMSIKSIAQNFISDAQYFFADLSLCVDKYNKESQGAEFSYLEQSLALRVSAITITILSAMALSGATAAFVAGSAGFIPLAAVSGLGFIAGHDLATIGNNMSLNKNLNFINTSGAAFLRSFDILQELVKARISLVAFNGTIINKDVYVNLLKALK
jgi:hypothetical protein